MTKQRGDEERERRLKVRAWLEEQRGRPVSEKEIENAWDEFDNAGVMCSK